MRPIEAIFDTKIGLPFSDSPDLLDSFLILLQSYQERLRLSV